MGIRNGVALAAVILCAVDFDAERGAGFGEGRGADANALVLVHLLHKQAVERQREARALAVGAGAEVDAAVFAAYPHAANQVGGDAHEPGVGVVAGGAGFGPDFIGKLEAGVQDGAGATGFGGAGLQHVGHQVSGFLAEHFLGLGHKFAQYVAVFVLDAGDHERGRPHALVDERGVGPAQLVDVAVRRAEADGRYRVNRGRDAEPLGVADNYFRRELHHQPGRDGVHGAGQGLAQRKHAPRKPALEVFGRVRLAAPHGGKSGGHVGPRVAGRIALVDGGGVHNGLEGRARLALALAHMVELEKLVVGAAHPGLDLAIEWVHGHEAGLQVALVVRQRIEGRQEHFLLALPGEHRHLVLLAQVVVHRVAVAVVNVHQRLVALGAAHGGVQEIRDNLAVLIAPG